jgi:hypothetical protein
MTFKDFLSINKVRDYYPNLVLSNERFIPKNIAQIEIEPYLEKQIDHSLLSYKRNETFADKFLIAPVLNNIWLKHPKLNLWTEKFIKADEKLQGRPDYLVSPLDRKQYEVLSLPIIILVEAKQDNFTLGWGQCLAEMLACQKLNKSEDIIIYGIVSTGQSWEFGKLEKDIFINDSNSYSISNLPQTLNIVNYIFEEAEKEIPKIDLSVILPDIEQIIDDKTSA